MSGYTDRGPDGNYLRESDFHPIDPQAVGDGPPVPGQPCPTCTRKLPYPKKESSPQSRTVSYRVPVDEFDAHTELLGEVERWLGCAEQPYSRFKSLALAVYAVLQDEELKGFAQRNAA